MEAIDPQKIKKAVNKIMRMFAKERLTPIECVSAIANALGLTIATVEDAMPENRAKRKDVFEEVENGATFVADNIAALNRGECPETNGEA